MTAFILQPFLKKLVHIGNVQVKENSCAGGLNGFTGRELFEKCSVKDKLKNVTLPFEKDQNLWSKRSVLFYKFGQLDRLKRNLYFKKMYFSI